MKEPPDPQDTTHDNYRDNPKKPSCLPNDMWVTQQLQKSQQVDKVKGIATHLQNFMATTHMARKIQPHHVDFTSQAIPRKIPATTEMMLITSQESEGNMYADIDLENVLNTVQSNALATSFTTPFQYANPYTISLEEMPGKGKKVTTESTATGAGSGDPCSSSSNKKADTQSTVSSGSARSSSEAVNPLDGGKADPPKAAPATPTKNLIPAEPASTDVEQAKGLTLLLMVLEFDKKQKNSSDNILKEEKLKHAKAIWATMAEDIFSGGYFTGVALYIDTYVKTHMTVNDKVTQKWVRGSATNWLERITLHYSRVVRTSPLKIANTTLKRTSSASEPW